jgi:hypothetical protein
VLRIGANYYDDVAARFGLDGALVERLRRANIMYDEDAGGQFFQLYSMPLDALGGPQVGRARHHRHQGQVGLVEGGERGGVLDGGRAIQQHMVDALAGGLDLLMQTGRLALQTHDVGREGRGRVGRLRPAQGCLLRVEVDDGHPPTRAGEATRQLHRECGLACPALLGEDGDHPGFPHAAPIA